MPQLTRSTPVLFVEAIAPVLPFWHAAGLETTMAVPGADGQPQFVALARGAIEVMLQTWQSLAQDNPALFAQANGHTGFLFIEVADLADVEAALAAYAPAMPRRSTDYGSIETGYQDPAGHWVTFAQFPPAQD